LPAVSSTGGVSTIVSLSGATPILVPPSYHLAPKTGSRKDRDRDRDGSQEPETETETVKETETEIETETETETDTETETETETKTETETEKTRLRETETKTAEFPHLSFLFRNCCPSPSRKQRRPTHSSEHHGTYQYRPCLWSLWFYRCSYAEILS
jgi:hypothetical protein